MGNTGTLSKKKVYYSFSVLYLLFMFDFMSRIGINSLFPVMQTDLGLTDSEIGVLGSVVLIGMAVFVLPMSYLADKISRKKIIVALSVIWGAGTIISALSDSYTTLLFSRFLVGLGNSAFAAVSVSMISGWFEEAKRGRAVSVYDTAMDLGFAVASSVCGILAGMLGWRGTLVFVGSLSLLVSVMSLFIAGEKKEECKNETKKEKINLKMTAKEILTNKPLLAVCVGAAMNNFLYTATFAWLTMFLVRDMGHSLPVAGTIVGGVSLAGVFGYPIGGIILDKWYQVDIRSRVWVPAISGVLSALAFIGAVYFKIIPLLFVAYVLVTMACPAPHIATQELVDERVRSVSYGTYVLFIQGLGAVGPAFAGVISQNVSLTAALIAVQFAGFIGTIFYLYASKHYIPVYNKVKALCDNEE